MIWIPLLLYFICLFYVIFYCNDHEFFIRDDEEIRFFLKKHDIDINQSLVKEIKFYDSSFRDTIKMTLKYDHKKQFIKLNWNSYYLETDFVYYLDEIMEISH